MRKTLILTSLLLSSALVGATGIPPKATTELVKELTVTAKLITAYNEGYINALKCVKEKGIEKCADISALKK